MRGWRALGAAVLLVLAGHPAWAAGPPARVWILPFDNPGAAASVAHLEEGLPALLAAALSRSDRHAVVERGRLDQVLAEQSLALEGVTKPEARRTVGRLLGATVIVSGSVIPEGPDVIVTMRTIDVETGFVTASAEARGPARQPARLVSEIYGRLSAEPSRPLPSLSAGQIDETPVPSLHFMRGLGYHWSARYDDALAELLQAATEPSLAGLARLWLANVYLAQREHAHAYLELVRLGPDAPGPSRRAEVEAKLRECERHLSAESIAMIRALASRRPGPKR